MPTADAGLSPSLHLGIAQPTAIPPDAVLRPIPRSPSVAVERFAKGERDSASAQWPPAPPNPDTEPPRTTHKRLRPPGLDLTILPGADPVCDASTSLREYATAVAGRPCPMHTPTPSLLRPLAEGVPSALPQHKPLVSEVDDPQCSHTPLFAPVIPAPRDVAPPLGPSIQWRADAQWSGVRRVGARWAEAQAVSQNCATPGALPSAEYRVIPTESGAHGAFHVLTMPPALGPEFEFPQAEELCGAGSQPSAILPCVMCNAVSPSDVACLPSTSEASGPAQSIPHMVVSVVCVQGGGLQRRRMDSKHTPFSFCFLFVCLWFSQDPRQLWEFAVGRRRFLLNRLRLQTNPLQLTANCHYLLATPQVLTMFYLPSSQASTAITGLPMP